MANMRGKYSCQRKSIIYTLVGEIKMKYGQSIAQIKKTFTSIYNSKKVNKTALFTLQLHYTTYINSLLKALKAKQQIIDALLRDSETSKKVGAA